MKQKIKNIFDISREIAEGITVWPGDTPFEVIKESSIENGEGLNISSVKMCLHTGTHIDAPAHFIEGAGTIETLDLSYFVGNAKVFEIPDKRSISRKDIESFDIEKDDIILFKTQNSYLSGSEGFNKNYVYLEESAANYLVECKVKTVGVDYLSPDAHGDENYSAHKIFLGNGIGMIENICLKDAIGGEYFLACAPLNIEGAEASPARAALIEFE